MIFKEFLAATMRKMMLSVYEYCTHAFREGRSKKSYSQPSQLKLENSKPTYLDKKKIT